MLVPNEGHNIFKLNDIMPILCPNLVENNVILSTKDIDVLKILQTI